MRTVSYEIYEGPQTITVISPNSAQSPGHQYITLAGEDLARRSRTYTVKSPDELPSKISKYIYDAPYGPQLSKLPQTETVDKKYTFRSESPARGRTEERSIEIVTRKESPARAPSPHPRGILRQVSSESGRGRANDVSKSSTSTTVATVGAATALTTTTSTKSRASSTSSSESLVSSASSATSVSQGTSSLSRTDFSSYARTSSRTGTFYFAYGPHISPSQLRNHIHHKASSSRPVALVRLQNFMWYINSRGTANLASCPPPETKPAETDADIVWGLLYNIDPDSESDLDTRFGWNGLQSGGMNPAGHEIKGRPWLQGKNTTNKMFLMVEAVEWLVDPRHYGLDDAIWNGDKIRAMTYIDEVSVKPGRIRNEYITQMSEAVATAVSYGIPRGWIDNVMRMYGIKPRRAKREVVDIEVSEEMVDDDDHDDNNSSKKDETVEVDEKVTIRRRRLSSDFY